MKNRIRYLAFSWGFFTLIFCSGLLSAEGPVVLVPEKQGIVFGGLALTKTSFNPSIGKGLKLHVELKKPAEVTMRVFDPDWNEVAVLSEAKPMKAGENIIHWNGKDRDGTFVPDEAYFFTVEVKSAGGEVEIYDPTAFSGGVENDLTKASIDRLAGTVRYRLPQMARVNMRIGLSGGPLLRTVVDWKPRLAGKVTDYWDGKDSDKLFDLYEHQKSKLIITYFTLPENSVISYGNNAPRLQEYVQDKKWPKKPDRMTDWAKDKKISHHYRIPRANDISPAISMEFPKKVGTADGMPILKGRSVVHVDLDKDSKKFFQDSKFEIVFFLDGKFYAEEETGFSPYNWVWDTSQVDEGTYLLTVNLSSFKDQIGVKTRKVKVVH